MQCVMTAVDELAGSDGAVLITGERGTGRALIGRLLHRDGARQDAEFISFCARVSADDQAADRTRCEVRQSLDAARGGTLLIREIADLPAVSQRRLLAAISPRKASRRDVRLIATCDPDLDVAAEAGLFHPDLFEKLRAQTVQVPPLRERSEDIPVLYDRFVQAHARQFGTRRVAVSRRVHDRLLAYPWPGNVAELKSIARRTAARSKGRRIEPDHLDAVLPVMAERAPLEDLSLEELVKSKLLAFLRSMDGYPVSRLYDEVIARVERPLLALIMERTGGNQVRAAEILGLNRNTLRRKLNERGLLVRTKAVSRTKSKARSETARRAVELASR